MAQSDLAHQIVRKHIVLKMRSFLSIWVNPNKTILNFTQSPQKSFIGSRKGSKWPSKSKKTKIAKEKKVGKQTKITNWEVSV